MCFFGKEKVFISYQNNRFSSISFYFNLVGEIYLAFLAFLSVAAAPAAPAAAGLAFWLLNKALAFLKAVTLRSLRYPVLRRVDLILFKVRRLVLVLNETLLMLLAGRFLPKDFQNKQT